MSGAIRLVAFDLDGTVLRGDTVCQVLAKALGHEAELRRLEAAHERQRDRASLRALRDTLAGHYRAVTPEALASHLSRLTLAPGSRDVFARLHAQGVATAIVSLTWDFAAERVARELGVAHWLGTRLGEDGRIGHVWPEDKARWLADLMGRLEIDRAHVAAVGDSWRDVEMFGVAGRSYYVGPALPAGCDAIHVPGGDLREVARLLLEPDPARATAALVPFEARHATDVVSVIAGVFTEYGMTFDLADWDADLQDIERHYVAAGGCFSVLVDGGRVVGSIGAVPKDATTCELKRLYLRPEYRGGGHGRRLIEHVLAWAAGAGYRAIVAWSDVRLGTAHQVYRRLGFTDIGERALEDIDKSREYGFRRSVT
jgi:phosphoserine phosphatase